MNKIKKIIHQEKVNRGIRFKVQNIYERARYGYSLEDTWEFDSYLSKIISEACRQMTWSRKDRDKAYKMCNLFEKYHNDHDSLSDKEHKEMLKLFKDLFRGMWL